MIGRAGERRAASTKPAWRKVEAAPVKRNAPEVGRSVSVG